MIRSTLYRAGIQFLSAVRRRPLVVNIIAAPVAAGDLLVVIAPAGMSQAIVHELAGRLNDQLAGTGVKPIIFAGGVVAQIIRGAHE